MCLQLVRRDIKKAEDLKAASETDVNIASLGFKPTLEYVRARYGDGWELAPVPAPAPALPLSAPTSFAEAPLDQPDAIDALVEAELDQWQPLVTPAASALQAAIDQSIASGETAAQLIARLPQLLADLPVDALTQSLTHAAFTARLAGAAGISTQ
jgi:hypothetical protein